MKKVMPATPPGQSRENNFDPEATFECGIGVMMEPGGAVRVIAIDTHSARRAPTDDEVNRLVYKAQYGILVQDALSNMTGTLVQLVEQTMGAVLGEAVNETVDTKFNAALTAEGTELKTVLRQMIESALEERLGSQEEGAD